MVTVAAAIVTMVAVATVTIEAVSGMRLLGLRQVVPFGH